VGERVTAISSKTLKTQALPALLSGTARQPLRIEAGGPLGVLSLAGQALRLERPMLPASFAVESQVRDERAMVPEGLRRPLIRLLTGKRAGEDVALAVAWAMGRRKLRLHPFDLPKLDGFVTAHAEHLGATAQHWAANSRAADDAPAAAGSYFDVDELEETNWAAAPLFRRALFLEERRRKDAAAARTMLESVWGQQNPDARVRLLAVMQTGLGVEDRAFLESLQKDRAPRVRALALKLLARLPGQSGSHPALAACMERIQRSTTGLLRKRAVLKLQPPANVQERAVKAWLSEAFADVSCDELARALDLSETAIIEASEKDEILLVTLALMATRDRRLDLLEAVVERLPDAWEQLSQCPNSAPEGMSVEDRRRWAGILIRAYKGNPPVSYPAWLWMHRAMEGAGPEVLFEGIVRNGGWFAKLQEAKPHAGWMDVMAGLCPASQRAGLRLRFSELEGELTGNALALLEVLDGIGV
jgi:hypothetical protein